MIQLTSKHPDFNISTAKEYCRELRTGRVPDFDIDDDLPIHVVSSIDLGVRNRDPPAYVKDPQRKTRRERLSNGSWHHGRFPETMSSIQWRNFSPSPKSQESLADNISQHPLLHHHICNSFQ